MPFHLTLKLFFTHETEHLRNINTFGIENTDVTVGGKPDRDYKNLGTGRRII
jgi:hypothetical protein